MAGKKREMPKRLLMFELKLWETIVRVAAKNADTAKQILVTQHDFRGAWTRMPDVSVTILGLDEGPEWQKRVRWGGGIISIVDPPPRPHKEGDTERINDLRKENRNK